MTEDHESWMHNTFGDDWRTTIAGYTAGGIGTLLVFLAVVLKVPELHAFGVMALGIGIGVLGRLAQSTAASTKDKDAIQQEIQGVKAMTRDIASVGNTDHRDNVRQIAAVKQAVKQIAAVVDKTGTDVPAAREL